MGLGLHSDIATNCSLFHLELVKQTLVSVAVNDNKPQFAQKSYCVICLSPFEPPSTVSRCSPKRPPPPNPVLLAKWTCLNSLLAIALLQSMGRNIGGKGMARPQWSQASLEILGLLLINQSPVTSSHQPPHFLFLSVIIYIYFWRNTLASSVLGILMSMGGGRCENGYGWRVRKTAEKQGEKRLCSQATPMRGKSSLCGMVCWLSAAVTSYPGARELNKLRFLHSDIVTNHS